MPTPRGLNGGLLTIGLGGALLGPYFLGGVPLDSHELTNVSHLFFAGIRTQKEWQLANVFQPFLRGHFSIRGNMFLLVNATVAVSDVEKYTVFSSLGCGVLGCDNVPCNCTHVRCSAMDCFGTYLTHVQTCDVTRVQSAPQWTASVHT